MTTVFESSRAALALLHTQNMPNSATVEAKVQTRIPGGGYTTAWQAVPGGVYRCRYSPLTVQEQLVAMQTTPAATGKLALPAGTQVTPEKRVVVTGVNEEGVAFTKILAVVGQLGPRSIEAVRYLLVADWTEGS